MKIDPIKYDVFISCKSEDYPEAIAIHKYLVEQGLRVFLADVELRKKGRDVYGEIIDGALESADHMIVFTSKAAYVNSTYVKSEWRTFVEEKRSGRKKGNIVTILKGVQVADLPIALRSVQYFLYKDYESVIDYLPVLSKQKSTSTPTLTSTPKKPYPNYLWALALMPLVLIGLWLGIDSYQEKQAVLREQQAQELAEAKAEQERIAQEKAEQERQAQEEAAKKAEQERQAKLEQERIAQATAEQERQAQEKAAKKAEQERLAQMVAEGKGRDGVYQVGDYYNRNGKQGVVFEVSADGRHGKIVSMMQMSAVYWSIDKVELQQTLGAFSNSDGASNMRIVQGRPNWEQNYPAFAWCATNGDDWYLPAIAEIVKFSISESVHNQVNKTLMKYNGMKLHDIGSANWYWSSTESEEPFDGIGTTDAKMVDMQDQCICDFTKHSDRTVRAVSAF